MINKLFNCKFLQFKVMHKKQAYSFKSYSKYYMIGTKFDICIKSEKNMKFNNLIHYYFMAEVNKLSYLDMGGLI